MKNTENRKTQKETDKDNIGVEIRNKGWEKYENK